MSSQLVTGATADVRPCCCSAWADAWRRFAFLTAIAEVPLSILGLFRRLLQW